MRDRGSRRCEARRRGTRTHFCSCSNFLFACEVKFAQTFFFLIDSVPEDLVNRGLSVHARVRCSACLHSPVSPCNSVLPRKRVIRLRHQRGSVLDALTWRFASAAMLFAQQSSIFAEAKHQTGLEHITTMLEHEIFPDLVKPHDSSRDLLARFVPHKYKTGDISSSFWKNA